MPQIAGKPVGSSPSSPSRAGGVPFLYNINGTFATAETTYSTATLANVSAAATSSTVAASNDGRRGLIVVNDSVETLYLKFGATASTTSYTVMLCPGETFQMTAPIYTGIIDGIWSAASGTARVTEIT